MEEVNINVQEICTKRFSYEEFVQKYNNCVHELINQRHDAGFTQQFIADWLQIDRRKIISFEQCENVDIEFMFRYAEKFADVDIDIKITTEPVLI